jgi:hypothetical protein
MRRWPLQDLESPVQTQAETNFVHAGSHLVKAAMHTAQYTLCVRTTGKRGRRWFLQLEASAIAASQSNGAPP